jgi:hypothetical protein
MPVRLRHALMSSDTSRQNKLWLATAWKHAYPWFLEWKWAGAYMRSRLCFRFAPDAEFTAAESFDEDVVPTFEFSGRKK